MIDTRYKNTYEEFLKKYEEIHLDPWHEISKEELDEYYNFLIEKNDIIDDDSFRYLMCRIIKKISGIDDAHTKIDMGGLLPINFRIFGKSVLVNTPSELKGYELVSINDTPINEVLEELENIITYGTEGRRKNELEKSLSLGSSITCLPIIKEKQIITYTLKDEDGNLINKEFNRGDKVEYPKYYWDYNFGKQGDYEFKGDTLVYKMGSFQPRYKEKYKESLDRLEKEDITNINNVIIDLRGNWGGTSECFQGFLEFLQENSFKNIVVLADYRIFSAGRHALREFSKLGSFTIGSEIGTPMNCFGNSHHEQIDGFNFTISEAYFNPIYDLDIYYSKEKYKELATDEIKKRVFFKPDMYVEETKEDYLNNNDRVLNSAFNYLKEIYDFNMSPNSSGTMYYFKNLEELGINFPCHLYIPNNINENSEMIVAMRTPRYNSRDSLKGTLEKLRWTGPGPIARKLVEEGHICLVPDIPRFYGIDANYLGYNVYHNNFEKAYDYMNNNNVRYTKEDLDKYKDIHMQVYNIIKFAQEYLRNNINIDIDDKVIMVGYSASSKFCNFFSALHSDIVSTIIAGGNGGNMIIPDPNLDLTYPLGVSDIKTFNEEEFKNIKQFYYIGSEDYNDSATFECEYERKEEDGPYLKDFMGNTIIKRNDGIKAYHEEINPKNGLKEIIPDFVPFDKRKFLLDENGDYMAAYSMDGYFTLDQLKYINFNIGSDTQTRFNKMIEIYDNLGVNAIFKHYPGDHATVFDNEDLFTDISDFVNANNLNKTR